MEERQTNLEVLLTGMSPETKAQAKTMLEAFAEMLALMRADHAVQYVARYDRGFADGKGVARDMATPSPYIWTLES